MTIDVTKIEGYAEMSAEDKIKALESYEYDDGSTQISKLKDSVSKACSDAAEWKKKHNALLTEEERNKADREEREAQREARIKELETNEKISKLTTRYMKLGYDAELAESSARAFAEGDEETLFANKEKFTTAFMQKAKADLLKDTPKPPAGTPTQGVDKAKFMAMSYEDQCKFIADNPDWQNKLK